MANGLLDEITPSDLSKFKKDFIQTAKICIEIDRQYAKASIHLESYIKKFEKLLFEFNSKYSIHLKIKKSVEVFTLRFFAKEQSVKDFFANSASKISGLKSIGRTAFNQADVSDMDKFSRMLDSVQDKVYVSYSDSENGNGSFVASFDRRENAVEIVFDLSSAINPNGAIFKILAYYALKEGIKNDFDIYSESLTFGFENLLNEIENREFYDRIGKEVYDTLKK